jgi:hypothetical protein
MPGGEDFGVRDRPHISISSTRETAAYTFPARGGSSRPRRADHAAHAAGLLRQLSAALGNVPPPARDPRLPVAGLRRGTVVEVSTLPPGEHARVAAMKVPPSLEFPTQDIVVLRSQRNDDRTESALLFVPDDARAFLSSRISQYGQDPRGARRPHVDRFEPIETVRAPDEDALFVGEVDLAAPERVWWELWLQGPAVRADGVSAAARVAELDVHPDRLVFPDTTVVFVHASAASVAAFAARVPGAIAEIRPARGTIEPFLERDGGGVGQHDWVDELAARVIPTPAGAPVVCALDTGVSAEHPLLVPGLRGAWAYDDAWGTHDHADAGGHGTALVGLILYGDLEPHMSGAQPVELTHGAESMKLLPPTGFPPTQPPSYGVVTQGAVALVETVRPEASRSFCLATSATDFPPERPSSWSGALDQAAAGAMPGGAPPRRPGAGRPQPRVERRRRSRNG